MRTYYLTELPLYTPVDEMTPEDAAKITPFYPRWYTETQSIIQQIPDYLPAIIIAVATIVIGIKLLKALHKRSKKQNTSLP